MAWLLLAAGLCFAPARAQAQPVADPAQALLTDQPGWTAAPEEASSGPDGTVVLCAYERDGKRAVLMLSSGALAAGVVETVSALAASRLNDPPWPVRVWTLRECRAWLSLDDDGLLHELGVVISRGSDAHPERHVAMTMTGRNVTEQEGLDILLGLDWDAIRTTLTR